MFGDYFCSKMSESSDSMYSSILMLENIWCYHFTYSEPNSQEIVNFYQFSSGLRGLAIGTIFTISCEFSPLHVKWGYHLFSSMKKEEYIESELSGIFQVKVATKDIVIGSLGTQPKAALQYDVSFWRNIQIFWTKLLHLSVFLVKQYTIFIYVKRVSSCLVSWAFPFVGSRGLISWRKEAKIFHAYEG